MSSDEPPVLAAKSKVLSVKLDHLPWLEHLPGLMLLCVGLLYGIGFLIVTLHYAQWGIHRISQELFKAEYIHIGILAITPPAAIAGLVICWQKFNVHRDQLMLPGVEHPPGSNQNMVIVLNFVTMLFLVLLVGPKSVIMQDSVRYELLFLTVFSILALCLLALYSAAEAKRQRQLADTKEEAVRAAMERRTATELNLHYKRLDAVKFVLFCAALIVDGFVINWMWPTLHTMVKYRTSSLLQYILISLTIGILIQQVIASSQRYRDHAKPLLVVAMVCICIPLAYMDILAFTHGVYPFIPESRGGANFLEADRIQLQPVVGAPQSASNPLPTNSVWLLMETESTLFIAIDDSTNAPENWFAVTNTPHVQAVNRSAISGWIYDVKTSP
jgi:hypothetical protein